MTTLVGSLHEQVVFSRRVRVLAEKLAQAMPQGARVLDEGCGDGSIASLIQELRPDVSITGIDVLVRPETLIPVIEYDGQRFPFSDNAFDVVSFVDVLHHTDDPTVLLAEAKRVASNSVVIKDHTRDGFLAGATLRFMDWVGNAHHGVRLPYNYWTEKRWRDAMNELGLSAQHWDHRVGFYPGPAGWLFDRKLHFVARLTKA